MMIFVGAVAVFDACSSSQALDGSKASTVAAMNRPAGDCGLPVYLPLTAALLVTIVPVSASQSRHSCSTSNRKDVRSCGPLRLLKASRAVETRALNRANRAQMVV